MPDPFASPTLRLTRAQYETVLGHCLDGFPDEACGLLSGPFAPPDADGPARPTGVVTEVHPCRNADASARTYTVDPHDYLRADRAARAVDTEIIGVWHSHTHTDAYPSATDVRKAVDAAWIYAIVSLKYGEPVLRAYRIVDGAIAELGVEVGG